MCKTIDISNNRKKTYQQLYDDYYIKILNYFKFRVSSYQDAEDLTSEVFLYCYKHFDTFDESKSSLSTWVFLVAKSRFYNYCRDRETIENIDDYANIIEDSSDLIEKSIYIEELRNQLCMALQRLTEKQQKIVVMKYFEKKSAVEIANYYNTTANNIRVQLSKALKRLQTYMEDWN